MHLQLIDWIIVLLTLVNLPGVRLASGTQQLTSSIKLGVLWLIPDANVK